MATDKDPAGDTRTSGFSEDERNELKALIAEAVGSAKPPEPGPTGPPAKTDDEWDAMSDRQRESWVRKLVDFRLDELAREDADARRDAEIEALKQGLGGKPEPEKSPADRPPGFFDTVRKWMWGEQDPK